MRIIVAVLLTAMIFAIAGCLPSIHPIYDEETKVYVPELLGTWTSPESDEAWVFGSGLYDEDAYLLTHFDQDSNAGEFTVNMAKIGGAHFIDLYPEELDYDGNGFYWLHYYRMHTFLKVELEGNDLRMYILDFEWFEDYANSNKNPVAHTYTNRSPENSNQDTELPVLTADTKDLQAFLASIADTPEAWTEPIALSREIDNYLTP